MSINFGKILNKLKSNQKMLEQIKKINQVLLHFEAATYWIYAAIVVGIFLRLLWHSEAKS